MENPTSVAVFLPVRVLNSLSSKALSKTSQKYTQKRGISLLEVLVSLVILSLIITGLFNTFISGKKFILHSRARMASAEMGRVFLDYLQMHVRDYDWDSANNALTIGGGTYYCDSDAGHTPQITGCPTEATRTLDNDLSSGRSTGNIVYNATYGLSGGPVVNLRKVKITITWNETPIY